jgi:hypothetical protein
MARGEDSFRTGALLVAAALIAAVFFGVASRSDRPRSTVTAPGSADPVTAVTPTSTPAGVLPARQAVATPPRPALSERDLPAQAAPSRPRSPLEQSPGYYPPDDRESMSVLTGRREAPAVDLELTGGAPSLELLGRMLLAALHEKNEKALHALRITRREFETIFWREFPQSRPITNITAADAWEMSLAQSVTGASRAVGLYGGRPLELVRVETGPSSAYRNFILHRETVIVARDTTSGLEVRLGFTPTIAERHGRFKALLYKD